MAKLNTREMEESRKAAAIPCRDIVRRRVSRAAYMRAIETEGPHVATADGESWWKEQERRHPFICAGGNRPEGTDSPNGHTNRFGKVAYRTRFVDGKLLRERWNGERFVRINYRVRFVGGKLVKERLNGKRVATGGRA